MNYITMGFLFAIGWHLGKATLAWIAKALIKWMKQSEWYQGELVVKPKYVEEINSTEEVKNRIGFHYEEGS